MKPHKNPKGLDLESFLVGEHVGKVVKCGVNGALQRAWQLHTLPSHLALGTSSIRLFLIYILVIQ